MIQVFPPTANDRICASRRSVFDCGPKPSPFRGNGLDVESLHGPALECVSDAASLPGPQMLALSGTARL
jgi:hypothetical protein